MTLKQYRRELDRALLAGPDALLAHMRRHQLPEPTTRQALIVTLHKTITASTSLPMEARAASKAWLLERGFLALDDGDVQGA